MSSYKACEQGRTRIVGIAATTKMTAAKPSRNNPAPSRRPGRFVEAAADMGLDAMAEQVGLALPSRPFRHDCSFAGSLIEGTLENL